MRGGQKGLDARPVGLQTGVEGGQIVAALAEDQGPDGQVGRHLPLGQSLDGHKALGRLELVKGLAHEHAGQGHPQADEQAQDQGSG